MVRQAINGLAACAPPFLFALLFAVACGGQNVNTNAAVATPKAADPGPLGKVISLELSNDSLRVDKVSMKEGVLRPDGTNDLAFNAQVEGPLDALFLTSTDEKGVPSGTFRADTLVGAQESPAELGGTLELGRLSVGIGVWENDRFVNAENGSLRMLSPGSHKLVLYVPNGGTLRSGTYVRLFARLSNGTVAKGPIVPY